MAMEKGCTMVLGMVEIKQGKYIDIYIGIVRENKILHATIM